MSVGVGEVKPNKSIKLNKTKVKHKKKTGTTLRNIVVVGLIAYYTIFLVIPILMAFVGSFHDWNPLRGEFNFTALENYVNLFKSELFWKSMGNTLFFATIVIIFRVTLGLGIATAIHSKLIKHKTFYRAIFYLPVVTPLVAVSLVWTWMYEPQVGLINQILGTNTNWLYQPSTALLSIIAMTIWKDFGYAVVLFLAGLCSLPKDCYEAACIDGASKWQVFKNITLPLLKPTTLFVVVTSIIAYLQAYVQILVMTNGGPGTETFLTSFMIYDEAFVKYNFGFASAMSFVLFVIVAILTYVSFKATNGAQGGEE